MSPIKEPAISTAPATPDGVKTSKDAQGWVIRDADENFWTGETDSSFSAEPLEAIRFSRRSDAQKALRCGFVKPKPGEVTVVPVVFGKEEVQQ